MQLSCPYCQTTTTGKAAKAGRYTPKCPHCGKAFAVTVTDPQQPPCIEPLPAADPQATAPHLPATVQDPNATGAYVPEDPQATGDYLPGTSSLPAGASAPGSPSRTQAATHGPTALNKEKQTKPTLPMPGKTTAKTTVRKGKVEYHVPTTLGGYQTVKELGRGGMGAVFLARQTSLDRRVALKIMNPAYAEDATFVSRFVREAYAAAQLTHHNVVQIYDIGSDHGWNFFSMEFVKGRSLGDLLRKEGKLDPEVAVGYILQAARGLKFAHDLGMVHRDIKPDNLMLSDQGVVKVADLGLVKLKNLEDLQTEEGEVSAMAEAATSQETKVGITMGTPAYMAPEQAQAVSDVDPRADIYSLGCTLYILLTGKPPFEGKTIMEVISKHATEPVKPPEIMVKRVPKSLSSILLKMMAKRPADRYSDMNEVIAALEGFLGLQSSGPFTPKQEHADQLEEAVKEFNSARNAKLRGPLLGGFAGACALLFFLFVFLGWPLPAGSVLGLGLLTGAAYFITHGRTHQTHLFGKARELILGSRLTDWLTWSAVFLLFLVILFFLDLLWLWLGVCLLAVGLAVGFHFAIDKPLAQQRADAIEKAEKLFRTMRLHGLDEVALRQFIAKYAGRHWEEFYETLFGYEAKLQAREGSRGDVGPTRDHFGGWRDPVIRWIDTRLQARKEAREKKHLQAVEEKSLQAQGLSADEARAKAEQAAQRLVHQAVEIKLAAKVTEAEERAARRRRLREMLELRDDEPMTLAHRTSLPQRLCDTFFHARIRFLLGVLLIAGCLGWMWQNNLLPNQAALEKAAATVGQAVQKGDVKELDKLAEAAPASKPAPAILRPLAIPLVPDAVTAVFDSYNPGVAGLLLVLSAFFYGWIVSLGSLLGAGIVLIGPKFGIPEIGPLSSHYASMAVGSAVALAIFVFGRSK